MRAPAALASGALLGAALAVGCASKSVPAAAPASAGAPAGTTGAEPPRVAPSEPLEPALLALEDRRAFDAAWLEAAAKSGDASDRARVALSLGRIGDERAGALLSTLLADSAPEVRRAAAFSAALLGDPGLSAAVAPLLRDPDAGVAARAAWALGVLGQPSGAAALATAIPKSPPDLRPAFLRALWRFATPEAAAADAAYASDPDARVRAAALYALARRPQESSRASLTAALGDPDPDTAAAAARGLGILAHDESIGPLWNAVADPRAPVRIAAMLALAAILEKRPDAALPAEAPARLLVLSSDTNPNLAVPALTLMRWAAADRDVFRRLWTVASSGKGRRQQVAVLALMGGLGEKARDLADASIASADPFLRGTVAEALSPLPAADARSRRVRLASDPETFVRLKVLEGLRTAEAVRENRDLVEAALADADAGVAAAAVEALAQMDEPATLPLLRDAVLRSYVASAPDVSISALAAAEAKSADPAARAVAEAAYRHPSVLVSRLARRALVQSFHADPAAYPWRTYDTGKSAADYARAAASEGERPRARVETERGTFTIQLVPREAPMTVQNFSELARRGYFDGVRIHRVAPGFVVQDGDPTGTGNGGPGYEIRDELGPAAYETGTVGMALAGPDTGGSQWFVTLAPEPHLDGMYTVFGRVVSGMDVVARIEQGDRIVRVVIVVDASSGIR